MSSPHRLLIVDDEDALRGVVRDYLTGSGYAVEVAARAHEALELAKAQAFDLAFVNVVLRGAVTGEQLAEILATLDIAVIMTGGRLEAEGRLPKVPYPFLMKPFRLGALTLLVEKMMRSRSSGRG